MKKVAILQLEDVVLPAAAVEVLPDEEQLVFLESCRPFEIRDSSGLGRFTTTATTTTTTTH